jgi:hypothetical protein
MKKTVFISSTFLDLQEERKEIWNALKKFNVIVKGMEEFGARPEDSLTTCLNEVEQADIYIGIVGVRFGSIDKTTNKSYTQLEYEKALESKKPVLIYLIDTDNAKVIPSHIDIANQEKLNIFKDKLKENHTIDFFKGSNDLVDKLNRQFKKYLNEKKDEFESTNEFEQSIKIIKGFFLTPKLYTGKELKLRIKKIGEPFPASHEVCSKFGMDYGCTIGCKINIEKPELNKNLYNFSTIFIEYKQIDNFLELDKENNHDIYARILFHDEKLSNLKTTFMDLKYEVMIDPPDDYYDVEPPDPYATYTKYEKGEGQVILILKEITTTAN